MSQALFDGSDRLELDQKVVTHSPQEENNITLEFATWEADGILLFQGLGSSDSGSGHFYALAGESGVHIESIKQVCIPFCHELCRRALILCRLY